MVNVSLPSARRVALRLPLIKWSGPASDTVGHSVIGGCTNAEITTGAEMGASTHESASRPPSQNRLIERVASAAKRRCCASTYGYVSQDRGWRGRESERISSSTAPVASSSRTSMHSSPARRCRCVVPKLIDRPGLAHSTRLAFSSQTKPSCREATTRVSPSRRTHSQSCSKRSR